ncbi:uncharacterized protein LOC144923408 [Branchiostoma floridae x Branchiostoma belcheri]
MLPKLLSLLAVLHTVSSGVIINELNADNPQSDDTEYIELYNTDNSAVALDTYVVVLYNGADDTAYDVIYLTGKSIPARGYFVIGSSNVVPRPDFVLPTDSNLFQNGPDGVALYNGDPGSFTVGMDVTRGGLVDAIVYSRYADRPADGLIAILLPGQSVVLEDENFDVLDESLSRCNGTDALNTAQFSTSYPSPGAANNCTLPPGGTVTPPATVPTTTPAGGGATANPVPDVVISELNADNPGADDQEYLELRNKGSVTVSLRNFVVVFYNGANNQAYYVLDLSSYSIPARGFFTIGSANVNPQPDIVTSDLNIQNGPDAVALYYGDPNSFTVGMTVTNTNLRDVLIYSKRAGDTVAGLTDVLAPGQQLVVENEQAVADDESISRCGGLDVNTLSQFQVTYATPGGENNCAPLPTVTTSNPTVTTATPRPTTRPSTSAPNVVINEVNADNPGTDDQEYVELLNKDSTSVNLNGLVLVYYNGANDQAYAVIDLSGGTIPANGFYTIGSSNVVPRPNVVSDTSIQNGPDAVALYYGNAADYIVGMPASRANLVDAVLYSSRTGSTADSLMATLAPGQQLVYENAAGTDIDVSASRCGGLDAVTLSAFQATRPTPGGENNCAALPTVAPTTPITVPSVIINELNSDTPGTDTQEYIELYNRDNSNVDLSDFQLVLYNGADNQAYLVIQLTGSISAHGYYTIGSTNVQPRPNLLFTNAENVIHNGIDAVALHYRRSDIVVGTTVSTVGLVDALVHTKYAPRTESSLIAALTPGQDPALELSYVTAGDVSLGRCSGNDPLTLSQFRMTMPTPGAPNNCNPLATLPPRTTTQTPPVSQIVINEMNADSPSVDDHEYIELYNKENRDVPLDYFVLALYNGNTNTAYRILSLNGRTIPRQGYFVIGTPNTNPGLQIDTSFIQNGPDAIALYYGDASRYSPGMDVTTDGLVDVVVYVNSGGDNGAGLTAALTPGQPPLHEDSRVLELDESLGRCTGNSPITLSQFRVMLPTPGRPNDCSPLPTSVPNVAPAVVLNELNADNPGSDNQEYIELFNTESVTVRLDNFVLVFYNGHDNAAYTVIDLSRNSIPARGYFVIGSPNVTPSPDVVLMNSQNILQNGVDAVGLYFGRPSQFVVGMQATGVDLIDAIVYSRRFNDSNPQLISALAPGESVLHEDDREFDVDETLSRCGGTTPFKLSLWQVTTPTAGSENVCAPPIVINEVNADNPNVDDQEFIELYNTDSARSYSLDKVVVVLYDGSSNLRAYDVIQLSGSIPPDGYFVIGSENVSPRPDFVLPDGENILQNGPDAVALYSHQNPDLYTVGMEPTDAFLVDVLVYSRNRRPTELISRLAPGQEVVLESSIVPEVSVSRCGGNDRVTLSQFRSTYHTPGGPNDCTPLPTNPPPTGSMTTAAMAPLGVVINEINADNPSYDTAEFIELYNPGKIRVSLDGVFLVLYNGATDLAYNVVDLAGNEVAPESVFVIGSANVDPRPDLVLERNENILQNGEDGVALYYNPRGRYYGGMTVTADNLLDAVVYSTSFWNGSNLILNTLTPGQQALHEYSRYNPKDVDESLSRCKGVDPVTLSQFVLAYPTPGDNNNCENLPTTDRYSSGLSGGGVAGVVIAVLIVLGVAAVAGFILFRRKTSAAESAAKAESGIAYNNMRPDDSVKVTGLPVAYDGFDNVLYNFEHGDNLSKVNNETDT